MRLLIRRTALLTLFASASIVSACAPRAKIQPLFPPAADVQAAVEPKPVPSADIVTSAQAAAQYDIAVESWGERVSAAGARICRWVADNGGALPFDCPEPR